MAELREPPPISPGDVLREEILTRPGVTQEVLASAMRVSRLTVNQLVNDRRAITADMAFRLATVLSTSVDFWLKLQQDVDVYAAKNRMTPVLSTLTVLPDAEPLEEVDSLEALVA